MHITSRWIGVGRAAAAALLLYGAGGVAGQLRLPALLGAALGLLAGHPAGETPPDPPGLGALTAFTTAQPWLPWAAWLLGLALLGFVARFGSRLDSAAFPPHPNPHPAGARESATPRRSAWLMRALIGGVLLVVLALGAYTRLNLLLPQARGLTQFPYDDEGVYAGAGQMVLQGILPYRDFFFAHPPLAALGYTPALAYHFTPWGSPTSFMMARYLSVVYSLGALVVLFAIGLLLGRGARSGLLIGATAAGLWALDGRAVEINRKIMLDQPMILLSALAVLAYLWAWRGEQPGRRWLALAGALAAASLLIKVQGAACLVALALDLGWRLAARRARLADGVALLGGAAGVALLVLGPVLVLMPDPFIRMAGFFQFLRPSDGVVAPPDRIANLTAIVAPGPHVLLNGPTIYLAAGGFLALTAWAWATARRGAVAAPALARWRLMVIWSFLSILLFTYSRSFYNHYYVQLVMPLCLLAGAIWLPFQSSVVSRQSSVVSLRDRFAISRQSSVGGNSRKANTQHAIRNTQYVLRFTFYALLLAPALLLAGPAWQGDQTGYEDHIFAIVGRYAGDAVPPDAAVLATDEQFNFLAARAPSHTATGYLIDSYGHMISLGLDLPHRSFADLLDATLHGQHSDDAYAIMRRPAPQADFLDRARQAALVVVHDRGVARLLPDTYNAILQTGVVRDRQPRYIIVAPQKAQ
jgi:hypothetical protein